MRRLLRLRHGHRRPETSPMGMDMHEELRGKNGPPDPKTDIVAPFAGGGPVAIGGAELPGKGGPGAAANDVATAVSGCPGPSVGRRASVAVVPAVLRPVPHVAVDLVEAP